MPELYQFVQFDVLIGLGVLGVSSLLWGIYIIRKEANKTEESG